MLKRYLGSCFVMDRVNIAVRVCSSQWGNIHSNVPTLNRERAMCLEDYQALALLFSK